MHIMSQKNPFHLKRQLTFLLFTFCNLFLHLALFLSIVSKSAEKSRLSVFWSRARIVHHRNQSQIYGKQCHAAIIIISASLEGLRSSTSRFIILSDLMSRLQPRKKMPNTTVSDSTQRTAICTRRMMN